ncbi:MAG: hypothetical protein R6X14_01820 [bacterium]
MAVVLTSSIAAAADLHARKMEIIQTPEGQVTVFSDSVTIADGSTLIEAQLVRLNESRGVAVVSDSVRISSPEANIRADSALYFLDARVTELFGRVRVEMDSLVITAPHLYYLVGEKRVDATSGLTLHTASDGMRLRGARGSYWLDRKVGEVDSLPVVVWGGGVDAGQQDVDSVTATARNITWLGIEEAAVLAGDVRVGTGRSALTADSLRYWTRGDTGIAWGDPHIADTLGSTEGDTIHLLVRDGALYRVVVAGTARGRYATAGSGDVEVAGRLIRIRFDQGELDVIEVESMSYGRLVQRGGAGGEQR